MRSIEGILPSIAFLESAPDLHRVEVGDEVTLGILWVHKVLFFVIDTFPALREVHQLLIFGLTQCLSQLCRCPRGKGIFQRMGSRETELLSWSVGILNMRHIAVLNKLLGVRLTGSERTIVTVQLILAASLISQFYIEVANTTLICGIDEQWQLIGSYTRYITAVSQSVAHPTGILIYLQVAADVV